MNSLSSNCWNSWACLWHMHRMYILWCNF